MYIAHTHTKETKLTKLNIYGFIFLNYGKIHSSDRRDACGDRKDIRPPGCAEEHGWSLGQIRQVLGRWRHTGKQENTENFDYEEALWTLW